MKARMLGRFARLLVPGLLLPLLLAAGALELVPAPAHSTIAVTPTTNGSSLAAALGGSGLTINSVTIQNGAGSQFGTYTGFTSPPVTFGDGVVLSTGEVADTPGPASSTSLPSTKEGIPGTTEFDGYGTGRIQGFFDSHDVAALDINFTLASQGQIAFDFIFGSVEYPIYVDQYTDAFLAFLDGTAASNQIAFDPNGDPIQVSTGFSNLLTTADTNTAFANPHGLLPSLTTFSPILAAGAHDLLLELGDVNDQQLDSAVFLANLRTDVGTPGTAPVPEPELLALLGITLAGLLGARRRRGRSGGRAAAA